jgi:nucleotide-binding universal stress UspA family protein
VLAAKEEEVNNWIAEQNRNVHLSVSVLATDARVEAVREEAESYDLVVMGATRTKAIKKFFFCSLSETLDKKL